MLYLFGKKLGTQHYPTVAGVGYTTPTYEIMDVGCWVHNNQLYKSWLLGTQQPTNFRRCVVLCWFLLVQPMSVCNLIGSHRKALKSIQPSINFETINHFSIDHRSITQHARFNFV